MIKIEFPSDRTDIALAFGKALVDIGTPVLPAAARAEFPHAVDADEADRLESLAEMEKDVGSAVGDWVRPEATAEDLAALESAPTLDVRLDEKGVPFNKELCANAAKPFYASGKEKGQWKRRPGVDQDKYDEWYAEELPQVPCAEAPPHEVNVEKVFSSTPVSEEKVPTNGGEFFAWVSEMQTAGHITQADLDEAYPAAGVDPQGIWTQPVEVQGQMFSAVYRILSAKVSG